MATTNVQTHQENYIDYYGAEFFRLTGAKKVQFTPRVVEKDGEKVVLVHIDGMAADASALDVDFWPRYSASAADLEKLPAIFEDIRFRIGCHKSEVMKDVVDEETGLIERKKVIEYHYSKPKFIGYYDGENLIRFNGKRSEFDETLGRSVWVEPEQTAETEQKGE